MIAATSAAVSMYTLAWSLGACFLFSLVMLAVSFSNRWRELEKKRTTEFAEFMRDALERKAAKRSAGVSLLEVLISMAILLVGVLLVATLLPVGKWNIVEVAKNDRSSACSRAAIEEVKIRGMNRLAPWWAWYPAPISDWANVPTTEPALATYQGYVLDPLFITRTLATDSTSSQSISRWPYGAPDSTPYLARVHWRSDPPIGGSYGTQANFFERIFVWPDEQVFDIPKGDKRPTRPTDGAGNPLVTSLGNFSWIATVLPGVDATGTLTGNCTVSVAVFYQRDFSPPSAPADAQKPGERSVTVDFTVGGGYGGGDVVLRRQASDPAGTLDIHEREWILVSAWQDLGAAVTPRLRKVCRWYQVTLVEEFNPNSDTRLATLNGSDWPVTWRLDANGNGELDKDDPLVAMGVICTGAISVRETTMALTP